MGPYTLCPEKQKKSQSNSVRFNLSWGALWAPSTTTNVSFWWASRIISFSGFIVPRVLEMAQSERMRTFFCLSTLERKSRSREPSGKMGITSIVVPNSLPMICQGTMLAWCSISVRAITSPELSWARPKLWARRLRASVVPRVKMISFSRTEQWFATIFRADAYWTSASSANS